MSKKKYIVAWSKVYCASGAVEVEADNEEEAERIVDEQIGDYEGSMQYHPDENEIIVMGEIT